MPSLAETQAAQWRARDRVMAMAAIIQTGQPDSLVLLPPSSAGETRAVGERRRGLEAFPSAALNAFPSAALKLPVRAVAEGGHGG
jgi:hypothetical protein